MSTILLTDKYISLYYRYYGIMYNGHETQEEAMSFLTTQADYGELSEIAIIEKATKKMVWYHKYYGKKDCQNQVDRFIKVNAEIF